MRKEIKGITIDIEGNATGLNKALDSVEKKLTSTKKALTDVNKLLKLDPGNADLIAQKHKTIAERVETLKEKLKTLKTVQQESVTTEEWDALQREIAETEQELAKLSTQRLTEVGTKLQDVGKKAEAAGKKLSTYVTAPLVAAGTVGVKKFAEVDKTMTLTNKTMGNTEKEAKLLQKAMEEAASKSTFGMNDAATASLNFARAGLNAEEAAATLAPAMNLAAGEGGNLDTVSSGLVATMKSFKAPFSKASDYADVFASACNNSALDVDSLSESMSVAAPIFAASGKSVEDAALYLGVMADNGIDAKKAANSLKTGMARLAKPTKEAGMAMDELGINVFNADGTMKDSVTIQKELHNAFSTLSEKEKLAAASAIFGKNQMAPWLALIESAPEDVENLSASLHNASGTTQEMADAMMSGFGGSIERLKSSLDVLMTKLGQLLAKYLVPIIEKVQKAVDWFMNLDEGTQNLIVKIALFAAALGPVLIVFGKIATGAGALIKGFAGIAGALSGGGGLIASIGGLVTSIGPYLLIAAAAVAAGVAIYKNWDKITEAGKALAKGVGKICKDIGGAVADFAKTASGKLSSGLKAMGTVAQNTWNGIKTGASNAWQTITTTISQGIANAQTKVSNGFNAVKTTMSNAWTSIATTAGSAWTKIKTTISNAVSGIATTAGTLKTTLSNAMQTAGTAMVNAFSSAKTAMQTAFNNLKTNAGTALTSIKTAATNAFTAIKNKYSGSFGNVLNDLKSKFSGIGSAITTPFANAWNTIKQFPARLKSLFSGVSISLPKIKMPHFSVTWKNLVGGIKLPSISVQWYKKAYENAVMFSKPTVLQTPYGAKGFGDGNGGEVVLGMEKLKQLVGAAGDTNVVINVTAPQGMNVNQLADVIQRRLANVQQQKAYSMT